MQDTTITATQRQVKGIPTRVVRAAAVQMSPVLYSREGTVDKVVQKYHAAISQPE
jgi:hypothetical protein